MRGCAVPQEALVGVHVQMAAVAWHLVQGVMETARQLPQTLHASGLQSRLKVNASADTACRRAQECSVTLHRIYQPRKATVKHSGECQKVQHKFKERGWPQGLRAPQSGGGASA